MERLTRRELWWGSQGKTDKAINYKVDEERRCVTHEGSPDFLIAYKLAEYEDLEEQGKLLKLPCVVGDILYYPYINEDGERKIEELEVADVSAKLYQKQDGVSDSLEEIGKEVFLTRPEAERALAEMEGKK